VACFPLLKNSLSTHHVSPPIHHVLTIKKPSPATHFFQNTPQKRSKTIKSQTQTTANFFLIKKRFSSTSIALFSGDVLPDGLPAREAVTS
jgi:hypothetical protein